jgi:diguanylate cyclase (GGDEF)-like protein
MKLHIVEIPKLALQLRASAVLGLIIISMLWAGKFWTYRNDVQEDFREVERRNQNYSLLFEENVLRSIGEIDKALLYLRRTVEAAKDTQDFQTIVMSTDVLSEIIVQVAIIDADGISRGTNAVPAPTGRIDVSDREHFRVHVNANEDKLFISKPLIGRASGKWSVQFTRRFTNRDGAFAGVVVASMDPAHFTGFYDKIDLGASTTVALVGSDGVVRSAGGGTVSRLALGQNLTGSGIFQQLQSGRNAVFEDRGASDDEALYVTARKVRGHPLWVTVSTRKSDVFNSSWFNLKRNVLIVGLLTLIILVTLEHILRAEARAAQKADQLQLILEHISQGIMLVTQDRQVPIVNRRCSELLRLPKSLLAAEPKFAALAEYEGKHGHMSPPIIARPADDEHLEQSLSGEPSISDHRRDDGIFIEVRRTQLPDGGFVQTLTDITTRREAEAAIARLASEDPLTGLPNRRVFSATLQALCDEGDSDFALLFMDMDRFKVVNDTLGHRVGDGLLIAAAARLQSVVSKDEVVARLGGDEFAVIVPRANDRGRIEELAKKIVEIMSRPFEIGRHRIRTSGSIGIAIGPRDGRTADDLLVASDLALYAVKIGGRGSYRFYEKRMNDELNERRDVEVELRRALEQGRMKLYFQPIVDLASRTISGFEALARWQHPTKGQISPAKFIAVAEDCGLIAPLGEWALMEACRAAAKWPSHLKISVNVSPLQLTGSDLPATIMRVLGETGIAPHRLALEFTERIFIEESDKIHSSLIRLKGIGVQIVLDDFGTGYSSLSYLRRFPFDCLKIDRSFVSGLEQSASSNAIVQAVILIAGTLGIRTVAEGVETAPQMQMLKLLGCNEVQGYLLGKPMPFKETQPLLESWTGPDVRAA